MHTRPRPQIHDIIGRADRILVMLDHDHRIAQIAQPLQRRQQHVVVALMEANARLIEHVKHARQPAANLAGKADTLRFAARQRAAGAIQIEVIQPDIIQKAQPLVDFLQDGAGNLTLLRGQLRIQPRKPCQRIRYRQMRRGRNIAARQLHAQSLRLQPLALTCLARLRGLEFAEFLAHPCAFGLQQPAVEVADHPLKRLGHGIALAAILKRQRHRRFARAIKYNHLGLRHQISPRRRQAKAEMLGKARQNLHVIGRWRV